MNYKRNLKKWQKPLTKYICTVQNKKFIAFAQANFEFLIDFRPRSNIFLGLFSTFAMLFTHLFVFYVCYSKRFDEFCSNQKATFKHG